MLKYAFKEWAVICRALAEGKQAILLRKGGITEPGPVFSLEHNRFWLFPTYVHQQADGIRPEAGPLLQQAAAQRAEGVLRLSHFVAVPGCYEVRDLSAALSLSSLHVWSEATVRSRFAYRRPGLFVLPVRVYRSATVHELPETAEYAGCRSWVELATQLPDEGEPVLDDAAFRDVLRSLDGLLKPTALA